MRAKVGQKHPTLDKDWKYSDIEYDADGWVNAGKYLPQDFDLCYLKTDSGNKRGWWTGNVWDGLRLDNKQEIYYWKRISE